MLIFRYFCSHQNTLLWYIYIYIYILNDHQSFGKPWFNSISSHTKWFPPSEVARSAEAFLVPVWHPCQMANGQWQTWDRKASDFGLATFGWASCIIDTFRLHWISLSSWSYNQTSMPGPMLGAMSHWAHGAHIALSSRVQTSTWVRPCPPLTPSIIQF